MRYNKILIVLLLISVTLLGFAGCTGDSTQPDGNNGQDVEIVDDNGTSNDEGTDNTGKAFKVGIASRQITNDFDRDVISYAQKVIEDAGGSVTITDGGSDPTKHLDNIKSLINSGIDGLVIVTGDPTQITPLVATANEKGIKVVTANFPECMEGVITNCNGDNQLNAALAANAFLSSINYKGNTWFVQVPGEPVLLTRERVYKAMAEDFPNVKVTTLNSEHNTAKVQTQIMDVLAANPEKGSIAGIYGSYDLLISAAVEAVRQAGRNEIKMVSIDGDLVAFQALLKEDSPFVASVVQNVPMIGTKAGEALLGAMEGKISKGDLPEMTFVDSYVATRHNVVAAAERRWGPEFWERVGVSKEEVEKQFPQKDELVIVTSVTP